MSEDSTESDEIQRDLDALYIDGRKPTLRQLGEVVKKHKLKLVSVEFPSNKKEEKSPQVSPRLYEALEFTFKMHGRDARKAGNVPYMAHLLSVCAMVQQDGGDEDEAVAALLHDALEDKPEETSRVEISELFGERVLTIIESSIDTPPDYKGGAKPPWRQRKEAYLAHVRSADPALLRVTIADKIDNARAILADYARVGDELWKRFNAGREDQLWYYESAVAAYDAAGYQGPLLEELRRLVVEIRSQTT